MYFLANDQTSIEQLLLLENLTYLNDKKMPTLVTLKEDFDKRGKNNLTVGDAVDLILQGKMKDNEDYGSYLTGADWKNILQAIKDDETLCDMKIVVTKEAERKTGDEGTNRSCESVLFVNEKSGEAVVAFRGTGSNEWRDNFLGGALTDSQDTVSTECQEEALAWFQSLELEKKGYFMITVIGHSKGGNKAQYITLMDSIVGRCVSFDGQGFSDEFLEIYREYISKYQWKITNHNVMFDFVNPLLNSVGEKIYYQGFDYGEGKFFESHCPNTYFTYRIDKETGKKKANMIKVPDCADEIREMNLFFNSYLRSLNPEEKTKAMDLIGTLVESAFANTIMDNYERIIKEKEGNEILVRLLLHTISYSSTHPDFKRAIKRIIENFYIGTDKNIIEKKIMTSVLDLLHFTNPTRIVNFQLNELTERIIGFVAEQCEGKMWEDKQIASIYNPLEKNRVFDINKLRALGVKGKELMDTGVQACTLWNDALANLNILYESIPGEVRSATLQNSIHAVKTPIDTIEHELMGLIIYQTTTTLAEEIPMLDLQAAGAIDEITENLGKNISRIKLITENIGGISTIQNVNIFQFS